MRGGTSSLSTPIRFRTSEYEIGAFDTYFLEHNLQGDIVALYCEGGSYIGGYTYDAWGNATVVYANGISTTDTAMLRIYNPFRYRGYYYDVETGLYYLQSRYYNPEWGRFISCDSVISDVGGSMQGYNMFSYCFNNPVNMSDSMGNCPEWLEKAKNWVNDRTLLESNLVVYLDKDFLLNILL